MARLNDPFKRTAREIRNYRVTKRLLGIASAALLILIVMTYLVSLLYSKAGSFTVSVNKFDNLEYSIALSEHADLANKVPQLQCTASKEVNNIDGASLIASDTIGSVDGMANGENYLCYTFYLINTGTVAVNIDYYITIANVERGLDEAVRLMLISNRESDGKEKTVYAKAAGVDENHQTIPEPGTVPFADISTVCNKTIENFAPGEVCKYTVVIWVEGPDPQCLNDKIGGTFKMDMKFNIAGEVAT